MAIYKDKEFEAFIHILKSGQVHFWIQIAEVLGIDKNTITAWKKLPASQNAIAQGLENALEKMETSGKNDWRMWEAKLKMLGLGKSDSQAFLFNDPRKIILQKYDLDTSKHISRS